MKIDDFSPELQERLGWTTPERRQFVGNMLARWRIIEPLIDRIHEEFPRNRFIGGGSLVEDGLYTANRDYIGSAFTWELTGRKQHAYETIERVIPCDAKVLDLGCLLGMTGLVMLKRGFQKVDFLDFEGLALNFLRSVLTNGWAIPEQSCQVMVYGQEMPQAWDWVVALDVTEHIPNPLTFIRWLGFLASVGVVLTYPNTATWQPPYNPLRVDEYVDTRLLLPATETLFDVESLISIEDGTEIVLRRKHD